MTRNAIHCFAFAALASILIGSTPCGAELSPNQLKEIELNPSPGAALPLERRVHIVRQCAAEP